MSLGHRPRSSIKVPYNKCGRKKRYPTEYEADRATRLCMQARGGAIRSYDCMGCGGFHLTSWAWTPSKRNR